MMLKPQPAVIMPPPVWYLGSWDVRKKYGVNQCVTLEMELARAITAARLVRGRGINLVCQGT